MAFKVSVDKKKCNGCEECLEACTIGMFQMINGKASPLADGECIGCESCMGVCDENAITVTDTRVALSDTCRVCSRRWMKRKGVTRQRTAAPTAAKRKGEGIYAFRHNEERAGEGPAPLAVQGAGIDGSGDRTADDRHRQLRQRDHPRTSPPAPDLRGGQGRHPDGGRHPHRVLHDRRLRRDRHGTRGDEVLAELPRADRRLRRIDGDGPPV